jgi:hypothetical protein
MFWYFPGSAVLADLHRATARSMGKCLEAMDEAQDECSFHCSDFLKASSQRQSKTFCEDQREKAIFNKRSGAMFLR